MRVTSTPLLALIVTRCRGFSTPFVRTASQKSSLYRGIVTSFEKRQKSVVSRRTFRHSSWTSNSALSAVPLVIPSRITKDDNAFMKLAIDAAAKGKGNTYPNPAVGCVLVSGDSKIIGMGFHPRAGYPHAEVFALFEACGYVKSGVDAAIAVVQEGKNRKAGDRGDTSAETIVTVNELLKTYSSDHGVEKLFKDKLSNQGITAYVTLEPCCHYGKTPPCAMSLVQAGVQRVVVGFRDPNPRVDGGGVLILKDHGIQVELMDAFNGNEMEKQNAKDCKDLVSAFVNRIKPRDVNGNDGFLESNYDQFMNGAKRRLLRNIAGRQKQEGTIVEIDWSCSGDSIEDVSGDGLEESIQNLELNHVWMERVDESLWKHELVVLRLTRAVKKKKGAKLLGERIANELGATVAQTVGHTVLLYRPSRPPILNFTELMSSDDDDNNNNN